MGKMLPFLKDLLDAATAALPGVTSRRAFGSWGYYVDDRIFALAYAREDRLGVKLLDGEEYVAARALPDASDWAPHGAPMSGWVLLPAELHDDRDAVFDWVRRAFHRVRAAPASALNKTGSAKKATKKKTTKKKTTKKKTTTKKAPAKKTTTAKETTATKAPAKKTAR